MTAFRGRRGWSVWLVLIALFAVACSSGGGGSETPQNGDDPIADGYGRVQGMLTDSNGGAIEGASITIGDIELKTDETGRFAKDIASGETVIRFSAEGYAPASLAIEVIEGATMPVTESLLKRNSALALNIDNGGTLGERARVTLNPGSLVRSDGTPVSGEVSARITPLDIMGDLAAAPGDFSARTSTGDSTKLETFGMAEYVFEDSEGASLNLADGENAVIEMELPAELNAQVGDTIPAWYFDEASGEWVEDGMGEVVQGEGETLLWRAQVGHFSWWNADVPIDERDCLSGVVTDCNGQPVSGASVTASGLSYRGESEVHSDPNGGFCLDIKRGSSVRLTATGRVNGNWVGAREEASGADAGQSCEEGGACSSVNIQIPCDPDESDIDCEDVPMLACKGCVSGRVVDDAGQPMANATVRVGGDTGSVIATAVTGADGSYCLQAPATGSLVVQGSASGYSATEVSVSDVGKGTCPACTTAPDLVLGEGGNGGFETCNFGSLSFTTTELDGADPILGTLENNGVFVYGDASDGYQAVVWMTNATDPENQAGTSTFMFFWDIAPGASAGDVVELEGYGVYNQGGVVGLNSEVFQIDYEQSTFTISSVSLGADGSLEGTFDVYFDTYCGMAIRRLHFVGNVEAEVVNPMDMMSYTNCLSFWQLFGVDSLNNIGQVEIRLGSEPMQTTLGYHAVYSAENDELMLFGGNNDMSFTLNRDAPIFGSQTIDSAMLYYTTEGCGYSATDSGSLDIETSESGSFDVGASSGTFSVELGHEYGDTCSTEPVTASGSFTAAVCSSY